MTSSNKHGVTVNAHPVCAKVGYIRILKSESKDNLHVRNHASQQDIGKFTNIVVLHDQLSEANMSFRNSSTNQAYRVVRSTAVPVGFAFVIRYVLAADCTERHVLDMCGSRCKGHKFVRFNIYHKCGTLSVMPQNFRMHDI